MIDARQAAQAAKRYAVEMLPEATDFLLEEVEREELSNGRSWLITLSMIVQTKVSPIGVPAPKRIYKVFDVDAESGEINSMRIREGVS